MKAYVIECRTGCSCCSYDNHFRGPYSSQEIAEGRVQHFHSISLLASQYAKTGHYYVREHDAEVLPDGRIIIDHSIFPGWVDGPGTEDRIETEWDAS